MRRLLSALLLSMAWPCLATPAAAEPPGASDPLDVLLTGLARPVPTATAFLERRQSGLLDSPLDVRGRLEHPRADVLVREVEAPEFERSTVEDGRVRVERSDGRVRRFSLRRAPELAVLLESFQALLSGDRVRLEQHYAVELHPGPQWQLDLQPLQAQVRERIGALQALGRGGELECLVVEQADGARSQMLLGAAAEAESPDFERHCEPVAEQ